MVKRLLLPLVIGAGLLCAPACTPPVITLHSYPTTPEAVSALRAGTVDAVVGDMPAMAYAARESMGTLEVVGEPFDVADFGIAVASDHGDLKRAVAIALDRVRADGRYLRILNSWGLAIGSLRTQPEEAAVPDISAIPQLADGTLTVVSDMTFPPMEFQDAGGTSAGVDVELARAIGEVLGVQVEFVQSDFDGLLAQVAGGEADLAMSAITITAERAQQVQFIPYMQGGSGMLVRSGANLRVVRPYHLCGHNVGVQEGTVQASQMGEVECR